MALDVIRLRASNCNLFPWRSSGKSSSLCAELSRQRGVPAQGACLINAGRKVSSDIAASIVMSVVLLIIRVGTKAEHIFMRHRHSLIGLEDLSRVNMSKRARCRAKGRNGLRTNTTGGKQGAVTVGQSPIVHELLAHMRCDVGVRLLEGLRAMVSHVLRSKVIVPFILRGRMGC